MPIFKNFNIISSRTIRKIFFMLCIPVLITLIFAYVINYYYIDKYKSLIISNYVNELNSFLKETENNMNLIINSANSLSSNPDIAHILTRNTMPAAEDHFRVLSVYSALKTVKDTSALIDSVAIYNRNGNFVITQSAVYDADVYFETACRYEKYPLSYFQSVQASANTKKILPASKLLPHTADDPQIMVPLVIFSAGAIDSNCLIILNINVNTIFNDFSIHKFTPNTKIYMTDTLDNTCFGESFSETALFTPHIIKRVKSSTYSSSNDIKVDGVRYLSISSTKRSNLWGYIYTVTVPYTDVNSSVAKIVLTVTIFIFIIFIVLVLFAFWGTMKLYAPWGNLINLIDSLNIRPSAPQSNIWDYIGSSISDISRANKLLQHNLSIALPLSQEKYLIDILNGNITTSNPDLDKIIFQYDYFVSISMHIAINRSFLTSIPDLSSIQFLNKIYNAISSIFANYFKTFALPAEDNTLYLLLNLESEQCNEQINDIINSVKKLFVADEDNISITFCAGNIYKGIEGLKTTHHESISNLMDCLYSDKIHIFSKCDDEYSFSLNSQNILINYLMAGYTDKAKAFLDDVFKNNGANSQKSRQQVYTDVLMTLYKVMRIKNIQFNCQEQEDEMELLHSIVSRPDKDVQSYILSLIDVISKAMRVPKTKIDIADIISYINEHYTEDIFLEQLAQQYNTSTKYLSKRIKQYLNITFKDYVTQLRIDKSKELLESSELKIEEIANQVGFMNRSTFVRAFKIRVGLSPSEYRDLYKK